VRRAALALVSLAVGCSDRTSPVGDAALDRTIAFERRASEARADVAPPDARAPDTKPRPPARWEKVADMKDARQRHTLTTLLDGTVLAAGGLSDYVTGGLASAERFDPKTGKWSPAGTMASQHFDHQAVLLADGRVLVIGGCKGGFNNSCMLGVGVELFDPKDAAKPWKAAGSMLTFRRSHRATLLNDGRVLVAGGFDSATGFVSLEIYDPKTDIWSSPAGVLSSPRNLASATTLKNGKVLIAGGYDPILQQPIESLDVFDPASGAVTKLGVAFAQPRFSHTATLLADGRVLVVGGSCSKDETCAPKFGEIYDPLTDKLAAVGVPGSRTLFHSATPLVDGRVLVVGGMSTATLAAIFDPVAMSWTATAKTLYEHYLHAAALVGEQVLVSGGIDYDNSIPIASAELYTP
jgi:hypothetical protein